MRAAAADCARWPLTDRQLAGSTARIQEDEVPALGTRTTTEETTTSIAAPTIRIAAAASTR